MVLSTKTKIKLSLSIILVLIIVLSGFWAYYKFYVKTPSYTIKATVSAIKEHDWKNFQQYVDVDTLADSISEPLLMGAMEAQGPMPENTKEILGDWIKMFKTPMTASIKEGIEQYVKHGDWNVTNESQDSDGAVIDPKTILEQIGLVNLQFVDVESVNIDSNDKNIAIAKVVVKQTSVEKNFPLELKLQQNKNGYWKIISITNFQDFMTFVQKIQREQMATYLEETNKLYTSYNKEEAANENKLSGVLAAGTLGNDSTRQELSQLINNTVIPQLENFKKQLQGVNTPAPAQTLQYLRLQVIDNKLAYYQAYGKWLTNKNIDELRKATESLNNYQTMEDDANALLKRITLQVKQ